MAVTSKQNWVFGATGLFILLNAIFLYAEVYWFLAFPVALFIVWLALFKLDWLMLLIVFSTPLSVSITDVGGGLGLTIPTDPLLFGALLVFLIRVLFDHRYDTRILKHPISIAFYFYLFWILFTSFTSELPMVSFKFFLAKLWFIVPSYFILINLFKHKKNIDRFVFLYSIGLIVVIIWTIVRHGVRGFTIEAAHWVMQPFFFDHTSYGALIAFFMPWILFYCFHSKWHINAKILSGFTFLTLTVGVIDSYTRAAWVSLVGAAAVFAVIYFRIKLWVLLGLSALAVVTFFTFQVQILQKLEKNKQDSSGDLAEHVESISNVATDASNLERLNRWDAAFSMFGENPILGKGPGTYSFLYAPYQRSANLTIISTNFGDGGNAHSEYFGPLAEQGVFGLVFLLTLLIAFFYCAVKLYHKLENRDDKLLVMGSILAATTYFIHGMLNNFLDYDKASVAVWGAMAVVTAMDVFHSDGAKLKKLHSK